MLIRVIIFAVINFTGLAISAQFVSGGVNSEWYLSLVRPSWTPSSWVFPTAWSIIMFCFSFYMAYLWPKVQSKKGLVFLFILQWILSVIWNPVFFGNQSIAQGLMVLTSLMIVVSIFQFNYINKVGRKVFLVTPYLAWLLLATAMNAFFWMNNF